MARKAKKTKPEIRQKESKSGFIDKIKKVWYNRGKNRSSRPHKSFRRSYREDYVRREEMKGSLAQVFFVFSVIKKNLKTFLVLVGVCVLLHILFTGMMSESLYQEFQKIFDETNKEITGGRFGSFFKAGMLLTSTIVTGGLNQAPSESQQIFEVLIFLMMWLTTIYILRKYFAGRKVKTREALYNSMGPFLSTMVVFAIGFLQAIPLFLVVITYSAAKMSDFLTTPFYALAYFVFAALMIILSLYMLTGTILALAAVTAKGVYPLNAISVANDLAAGRRFKISVRLVYVVLVLGLVWLVVGLPVILLDMLIKTKIGFLSGVPIVPFVTLILTCFSFVFLSAYLYVLYREVLDLDMEVDKKASNG